MNLRMNSNSNSHVCLFDDNRWDRRLDDEDEERQHEDCAVFAAASDHRHDHDHSHYHGHGHSVADRERCDRWLRRRQLGNRNQVLAVRTAERKAALRMRAWALLVALMVIVIVLVESLQNVAMFNMMMWRLDINMISVQCLNG